MKLYHLMNELRNINSDDDDSDDDDDSKAEPMRRKKRKEIKSLIKTLSIAEVKKPTPKGHSLLYAAVENGDVEVVESLLDHPGIDVNYEENDGTTPLSIATMSDNRKVVKSLLTHPDIDVNRLTSNGSTLLYIVTMLNYTDMMKLLLAHPRIDVNQPTSDGKTPFDIAIMNEKIPIINLFLTYNNNNHTKLKSKILLARKSTTYVLPQELWDFVSTYVNTPAKFHNTNLKNLEKLKKRGEIPSNLNVNDFIIDPSALVSAGGKSKKKIKKYKKRKTTVKKYYIKKRK